ncbi:hypothetical protein [Pseudomonas sp. TNT3]|uniref:hypothetical protein n=1 Tax=Pseudomonas sp. TNT3 TaxID=2654097 RepID=UPI001390AE44|nr:hypothetical protein [Pseudomonas sp. TNT3]KAI2693192.1 hypothetical protein GBC55_006530 [Pseudomonas sp. TNT3]
MAGPEKKEQRLAAGESSSGGAQPLVVQDPDVKHIVINGDANGLIRREKLKTDQTVTITTWGGTLPGTGDGTDYFRLERARGGSEEWTLIDELEFEGGDIWIPLVFTITKEFFLDPENEGPFDLRYEHISHQGPTDHSNRVRIFIDKIPPNGTTSPSKMIFTITPPIKDSTFGADDFLEATIPDWTGDPIGTHIAFGWIKGELPEKPEDIDMIGPLPILGGGKVQIPKAKFLAAGDGNCCAGYVLIDKAGNESKLSEYELMSVALGPLPLTPLPKPTVTDATGGELLREDIINGGVIVHIDKVTNGKANDSIIVKWKDLELKPGTPVGPNPTTGFDIFVPWNMIKQAYGDSKGVIDIPVSYTVLRGVEPFGSAVETVKCNLSNAGPDNPDPEPGNPNLKEVAVVGESAVKNVLINSDEGKDVFAEIELVLPLVNDDTYQVMWNGKPIGPPYVIDTTNDKEEDVIRIPLDWDVIRGEGPSDAMPIWYVLTNAAHSNPQEPKPRSTVEIKFLVLKLPTAEPLHTFQPDRFNCNSLRWNAGQTEYGFEYRIPPSAHLKAGDDVEVVWEAYQNFAAPVHLPGAKKTGTFTNISAEQARDGIVWLIEPYDTHIKPIYVKDVSFGKGDVTYTIKDKPAAAAPSNTRVGLLQGEGSCEIPAKP